VIENLKNFLLPSALKWFWNQRSLPLVLLWTFCESCSICCDVIGNVSWFQEKYRFNAKETKPDVWFEDCAVRIILIFLGHFISFCNSVLFVNGVLLFRFVESNFVMLLLTMAEIFTLAIYVDISYRCLRWKLQTWPVVPNTQLL
jgi:hypothetical protein